MRTADPPRAAVSRVRFAPLKVHVTRVSIYLSCLSICPSAPTPPSTSEMVASRVLNLRIGRLRQAVPRLLLRCWPKVGPQGADFCLRSCLARAKFLEPALCLLLTNEGINYEPNTTQMWSKYDQHDIFGSYLVHLWFHLWYTYPLEAKVSYFPCRELLQVLPPAPSCATSPMKDKRACNIYIIFNILYYTMI